MLPVAFLSSQDVTTFVGGLAAAVAIGAFIGQALTAFWPAPEQKRRLDTALGGFLGALAMIGLILFSAK